MILLLLGPMLAWSVAGCAAVGPAPAQDQGDQRSTESPGPVVGGVDRALPAPDRRGGMALAEALDRRRSVRSFAGTPLDDRTLGQLLWATQGASGEDRRTAPSAGATYPLEVLVATADGLFRYRPGEHALRAVDPSDLRATLAEAARQQDWIATAPAVVVIAAVAERTVARYGTERARRYVAVEAGHAAQNLLLMATALGLGSVPVGAFDDGRVRQLLGLAPGEEPLYLLPVGRPAG